MIAFTVQCYATVKKERWRPIGNHRFLVLSYRLTTIFPIREGELSELRIMHSEFCIMNSALLLHVVNHLHDLLAKFVGFVHAVCLAIYADDRFGV